MIDLIPELAKHPLQFKKLTLIKCFLFLYIFSMSFQIAWSQSSYEQRDPINLVKEANRIYSIADTKEQFKTAFDLYQLAAREDIPEAIFMVGLMQTSGEGVTKNLERAYANLLKATALGNYEAPLAIGDLHFDGEGRVRNEEEALRWYGLAAIQGHPAAKLQDGLVYLDAKSSNSISQADIGAVFYSMSKQNTRFLKIAHHWISLAANNGDPMGELYMGNFFYNGEFYQKNYSTSLHWYKKAAAKGNATAQAYVANQFFFGEGTKKDFQKASDYSFKSSQQGDVLGMEILAEIFRLGLIGEKKPLKAFNLYLKAAEAGNSRAAFRVGYCFNNGINTPTDFQKAKTFYEIAAKQKNVKALNKLARLYKLGQLGEVNFKKAAEYNIQALSINPQFHKAAFDLGEQYFEGIGVQKNLNEALRLIEIAARNGSLKGAKKLSDIYRYGMGVKRSKQAYQYWSNFKVSFKEDDETKVFEGLISLQKIREENRLALKKEGINFLDDLDQFGNYFALVFGNNEYTHLSKLNNAIKDARDISDVLENEFKFEVELIENATRSQILDTLYVYRTRLTKTDNLLIYYAGHGIYDEKQKEGFLQPINAKKNRPSSWISNSDIKSALMAIDAKHILLVSDSCFSGTFTKTRGASFQEPVDSELQIIKKHAELLGRSVISSGNLEPVADQGKEGNSIFAHFFLKALKDNSEPFTGRQLFREIEDKIIYNSEQSPQYGHLTGSQGGDFIFVKKNVFD